MIYESVYWKEPLLKSATFISSFNNRKIFREAVVARLEREIMIGFYSVRKLIETKLKLSRSTIESKYRISRYRAKHSPSLISRWEVDEHYDFGSKYEAEVTLSYITNQIIHSFVFVFAWDDDRKLEGVLFSSDRDRARFCNYITLEMISDIFQLVGRDYPSNLQMKKNEDGEWEITLND